MAVEVAIGGSMPKYLYRVVPGLNGTFYLAQVAIANESAKLVTVTERAEATGYCIRVSVDDTEPMRLPQGALAHHRDHQESIVAASEHRAKKARAARDFAIAKLEGLGQ